MSAYPLHTIDSAPAESKPVLQQLQQAFGVVPNIAAAMAASPVLINGFIGLFERVHASSLTEPQIQTLLLTNAVTNASEWPVAFHTALALKQGVRPADVDAIRRGELPADAKLATLSATARALIDARGRLSDTDRQAFVDAGFTAEQLLEVIAVVAASTITNYVGSVARPALEAPFDAFTWHAHAA
ncbi:carboxymuconolactone decarboxylase family protein [Burkholderia cenocepacia]|uniref:carboxymuconolactone decarboxylase family protein n=1 Tax=Burkholderia cepacia complex TaxID=87882 RepID=UPI001B8FD5DD|nr:MULTISPECIES: carboxymuconolactone decarboxylase family protein [Burkholderia cepacia complex]MBR8043044.1 carboxymuconolactone decarboxylase family protein [Burkholderia cenocepacia]MBR8327501.1 carboxymuconolactone decarboxylase family protein [Burkholderia cenocepacia]MDN7578549.1 carboxymuconolactone decarboxylase family protein [Burkholderia orbicola]MDN7579038.1 carboxymuconolactone decarboxylase family protein [Burkholderia orbicola]